MQLVSSSLIQDLIDVVVRAAQLSTTDSISAGFSGSTIAGSFPAILMGIMNSGRLLCSPLSVHPSAVCFQEPASREIPAVCFYSGRFASISCEHNNIADVAGEWSCLFE